MGLFALSCKGSDWLDTDSSKLEHGSRFERGRFLGWYKLGLVLVRELA